MALRTNGRARLPDCPDVPKMAPSRTLESRTYAIHVVTPLFGGGVHVAEHDPITLIRGSSVRGHLRFWWRATHGALAADERALLTKESEVWGNSVQRSRVSIRVTTVDKGVENRRWRSSPEEYPPYVLFPFTRTNPPASAQEGVKFELQLSYLPEHRRDVLAALWAWANFGGIGARTRRGCGSLYCGELSPAEPGCIDRWLRHHLEQYGLVLDHPSRPWSTLSQTIVLGPQSEPCLRAWKKAVQVLQGFKQQKHPTLSPIRGARLASPIIVKPLAVGSEKSFPMLLFLSSQMARGGKDVPVRQRSPKGSAVEALLAYAREQGFRQWGGVSV